MMGFYVYEHWRPDTDVCFYVGKGKGDRAYIFNRKYNRKYNFIVRKLARLGLCVEVRLVAGGLSQPEAFSLEMKRITFWRDVGVNITNKTEGGEGSAGRVVSQKTREKMRDAMRGRSLTCAQKTKLREVNLGKRHTLETRAKMSESRKGNTNGHGGRGLVRSPETRARISAGQVGRFVSQETREKISRSLKCRNVEVEQ